MKRIALVLVMVATAFVGAVAAPASSENRRAAPVSTEMKLASRGISIPATVVMPAKVRGKVPLVVIHHGHGGGRNENGGLARVADALARAGIASIRFDFAGAGESSEPFTKLSYTTMLADSNAALTWAVRNLPIDTDRIGGFGYSEGSAVVAMQSGQPFTPYKAVALLGPVARPLDVFGTFFGGRFDAYYDEAKANGFAVVTTPFGQVQNTSLEWFQESIAAAPTTDLSYFDGRVQLLWGDKEQIIPFSQVEAFQAAATSAKRVSTVVIADADHGYGFYSDQPAVDDALHGALVQFFTRALRD